MPTGVIIDALATFLGGIIGSLLTKYIDDRLKDNLTMIFGLCAIGMGIVSVILLKNLPAVILSLIAGTICGLGLHIGDGIRKLFGYLEEPLSGLMTIKEENRDEYISSFITLLILFCASANGVYGSMDAGFSHDHTILISKAILDFFTAMIFACNLGRIVSLIALPQFVIYFIIFILGSTIYPLMSPVMIADFKGCGGLLMIATGMKMLKIKDFPLADMIMSLLLVIPVSHIWTVITSVLL